jgi:hypothetical protein
MKKIAFASLILPVVALGCQSQPSPTPAPPPVTAPPTTRPAPVSLGGISLGKAIEADKKVTAETDTFAAKDTIYASVSSTGTGHAKLRALWSFVKGEKTAKVDETTLEVDAAGPALHEFHIAKPSGWPKGDYKIEVFLNDGAAPAATKTFKVS